MTWWLDALSLLLLWVGLAHRLAYQVLRESVDQGEAPEVLPTWLPC